jgi:putative membrane protein
MDENHERIKTGRVQNRRVHMANERTFLAWIRTSIGIMAFGFVVEKFALFIKQMGCFLAKTDPQGSMPSSLIPPGPGYSFIFGIVLIGLGALMGMLAFIRYKKTERQIDEDSYHPSLLLDILLTLSILAIGIFLVITIVHSF